MRLNRMRLTSRLILLALVAVLPAIMIQIYNLVDFHRTRAAEIGDLAIRQAQLAASELDRVFEGVRNLLTAVSTVKSVQTLNTQDCVGYLGDLQPKIPHILRISIFDAAGRLRCSWPMPSEALDFSDRRYIAETLGRTDFVVGEYSVEEADGRSFLPLSIPLLDGGGRASGVVMAALDLAWLGENLRQRGLPPGSSLTVADRSGIILAREPLPERFVGQPIPEGFRGLMAAARPGALEVTSQDGTRRVLGYVPISDPTKSLYVSAGLSAELAFAGLRAATLRFAILLALGLASAMAAALVAGRLVIKRPVDRLLRASSAWQHGDFSVRSGLAGSSGEFGEIGEQMDRVAEEVERREKALREGEERYRALVSASAAIEWRADPDGNMQDAPLWEAYTGQPAAAHRGWGWLDMVHPEDRPEVMRSWEEGHASHAPVELDYRVFHTGSGQFRWVHESGVPLFNPDGSIREWVGAVTDIHERRHAEERQQLLLHELNHRVKNTLASVQAIVAQTLRFTPAPLEAEARIQSRLMALSATHNLLNQTSWSGAELRAILDTELAPYRGSNPGRIVLDGPSVKLDAKAALAFGLVIHELATNAAKYGALAADGGRVEVSWRVTNQAGPRLELQWREQGGPPVAAPSRSGFGSRLIGRSVRDELQGELRVDYPPEGITCSLSIPLGPDASSPAADSGDLPPP